MSFSKNKRIAFIEDDGFFNLAYKYGLEKEGYNVLLIPKTSPGFMEVMVQFKPDFIILDLIIQPVNGFVVLEELKKTPDLKKTPIIVFSNLQQESDIKKCLKLGASDYLIKTLIGRKEFIEKIKNYLIDKQGRAVSLLSRESRIIN